MVQVKIKLKEGGILPKKANEFASGYDCYANLGGVDDWVVIRPGERRIIELGFFLELPTGYEVMIRPRSGLARDFGIAAAIGTIDSDYRGIVGCNVFNHSFQSFKVTNGMRICQMVIQYLPKTEMIQVDELSETERGEKGFGHTGL